MIQEIETIAGGRESATVFRKNLLLAEFTAR
jgi:hypothetical protein